MNILINAANLSSAGGLTYALNFLENIYHRKDHVFHLIAPPDCGYEKYEQLGVHCYFLKKWEMRYFGRVVYDNLTVPNLVKKINPDVIFTMGNFAIPVNGFKQVVLFAWPYPVYPESTVWNKFTWTQKLVQKMRLSVFVNRLKYADTVLPQTPVAAARFRRLYPQVKNVSVVPTSYSVIEENLSDTNFGQLVSDKKNLLCLTRYYLHKNIEILLEVAEIFKSKQYPYRIVLTLGESQHPNVALINQHIKAHKLEAYIVNIGPVPIHAVTKLYSYCEGMILPTLLESFSATYVDSMYLGKSIFTSDLDFAQAACGDAAFYFNPDSADSIAEVVHQAFLNPEAMNAKIAHGKKMITAMPDWKQVSEMYLKILADS